jgi:hypothetical protein
MRKVVFRQHISKKHQYFGIKFYKLCNRADNTFNMNVYLGKKWEPATTDIMPTNERHSTAAHLKSGNIGPQIVDGQLFHLTSTA